MFNFNSVNSLIQDDNLIFPMACVNDQSEPKIKFLGVLIDPNLTFKEHIQNITHKINSGLFFLRSVRNFMNERALKYMYYSLVHCHIIYAIHIYSCATESLLKPIFLKQKQAIRIITQNPYNSHTEPLFKKLGILPFPELCTFFKLQFMHNYNFGYLPQIFDSTWVTNRTRRQGLVETELRNDNGMYVPHARTNYLSRMPLFSFPKIWTNFENELIKSTKNKSEFNLNLKNHFLNNLSDTVICNRLLCPTCHL
jgi:hypothetical protein